MKIAIITDQHFGKNKNSEIYWKYFLKFYNNIFFPTLQKYNISTIIDMGDTTDNRKLLELDTIYAVKSNYYDRLRSYDIHSIVGNHQIFYKDSNHINAPNLVLDCYSNVMVYAEPTTVNFGGLYVDLIPWVHNNNKSDVIKFIDNSKSSIAFGHLQIVGAFMFPGHYCNDGLDLDMFAKYKNVYSGHLHFRSKIGNITYVGNPYHLHFGDIGSERGFCIYDTETNKLEYINNPYNLFYSLNYAEIEDPINYDVSYLEDSIVKLFVNSKHDTVIFDLFVKRIYDSGVHQLKIIEVNNDNLIDDKVDIELKDTLSMITDCVSTNSNDYKELIGLIKDVYTEAVERQTLSVN